ncbi:unknown [Eubacterium sp. CAG:786]|nr:unknown [Eubacterium sp. CAG:786]
MTPQDRYCKTRRAAVVADARRKRQRCMPRDAPRINHSEPPKITCTLYEGAFLYSILRRFFHG